MRDRMRKGVAAAYLAFTSACPTLPEDTVRLQCTLTSEGREEKAQAVDLSLNEANETFVVTFPDSLTSQKTATSLNLKGVWTADAITAKSGSVTAKRSSSPLRGKPSCWIGERACALHGWHPSTTVCLDR